MDLPHDGRRPGEESRRALEAFAMAAELALEHLDDDESGRRVAERVTERVAERVAEPILYSGAELRVTASVGLAFDPGADELDLDALMRRADTAVCQAKNAL